MTIAPRDNNNSCYRSYFLAFLVAVGTWLSLGLLAGCGGNSLSYTAPAAPISAEYTVNSTPNYYTLYSGAGNLPADPRDQFSSAQYPIQISYELDVANPTGFDLVTDTESAIACWAKADPRVCTISGVAASQASLHVILTQTITAQTTDAGAIVGLTTIDATSSPSFTIQIATSYGSAGNFVAETSAQMEKTLCHELGHTLGLGHSPNPPDLMYFMENNLQGSNFANFLTYADAVTLWTTLNAHAINWVPARPVITQAQPKIVTTATRHAHPAGTIIDIYRPASMNDTKGRSNQ